MKKLLVLLAVAVLVTGFAFAQESGSNDQAGEERTIEFFNAEINVGFPIHWANGRHDGDVVDTLNDDKTVTANTAIGVGIVFNFTNKVGLIMDADFFYGATLLGESSSSSHYVGLSGANIYLGPLFYLYNNNTFRIPLMAGFHMYYFSDELWFPTIDGASGSWISASEFQFGLAFSLGLQFHFNSGVYLFSRTNVSLDFIRLHYADGLVGGEQHSYYHLDLFDNVSWHVKPAIGIGISF